jgi:hypothetical protein
LREGREGRRSWQEQGSRNYGPPPRSATCLREKPGVPACEEPFGAASTMPANTIYYSDKYYDETFEYRCVRVSCVPCLRAACAEKKREEDAPRRPDY